MEPKLITSISITNPITGKVKFIEPVPSNATKPEISVSRMVPEFYHTITRMIMMGFNSLNQALDYHQEIEDYDTCAKIKKVMDAEAKGELYQQVDV